MMTTSYPGVYVNEVVSLSLSISSSETAVPVIFTEAPLKVKNPQPLVKISSWAEAQGLIDEFEKVIKFTDGKAPDSGKEKAALLYAVLRSYFDNGGGRCYVTNVNNSNAKNIAEAIKAQSDVTLLVQAGVPSTLFELALTGLDKQFIIMDAPEDMTPEKLNEFKPSNSSYRAAYYPWLVAPSYFTDAENKPVPYTLPPSTAVAGVYCKTDSTRGVWKTPANVALAGGLVPAYNVSDEKQGEYNDPKKPAINMIRKFRNGDTLVWGGRTRDVTSDWRYIAVRRLFKAAETDIKAAMAQVVFEPNTPATWEIVRAAIDNYLHKLWQQGGLFGNKPEEAYFVRVGKGITMTDDDIKNGTMNVRVGIAAVRPAEFIILEFSQLTASAA